MAADLTAFDLVFEGPVDDKPETIRRLKAAFLVDLNLPIERVQEILQQTPAVIISSDSEMELSGYIESLTNAGGKALIVRKHGEDFADDASSGEMEFDLDLDIQESTVPSYEDDQLFHFDSDNQLIKPEPKEPKTYELPSEDSDDDDPIIPEILIKPQVELPLPAAPVVSPDMDLTLAPEAVEPVQELALGEPVEELDLLESNVANALLLDDGENYGEKLQEAMQEVIEEHTPVAETEPTAVSMVLQSLNTSLMLEEDDVPEAPPPVTHTHQTSSHTLEVSEEEKPPPPLSRKTKPPVQSTVQPQETSSSSIVEQPVVAAKITKAPPLFIAPAKKKFPIAMTDVVIPILIGAPLVLLGNWFYFDQQPKNIVQYDEVAKALSVVQKQVPKVDKEAPAEKLAGKQLYIGRQAYPDRTLDADISVNSENKKMTITLKLETPPPPELTAEQIGRRERKAPWIRKVEIDKVTVVLNDQGKFEATPGARIYVEDEGNTTRLVGSAVVNGYIDQAKGIAEATVQVTGGKGGSLLVARTENGKFDVSLGGTVTARNVATSE